MITAGQQMAQQANANSNKNIFGSILINVKAYGAEGDDKSDDTASIQKALNEASSSGSNLFFPPGIYKVTAPLVLNASTANGHLSYPKMIGSGACTNYNFIESDSQTIIKGYGIATGRGVLELTGTTNGFSSYSTIEEITILQDRASCHDRSFALVCGNSWMFRAVKCVFSGNNGIKIRCGGTTVSYAQINTKFEQCLVVGHNSTGTGFSVMPEAFESSTLAKAWDNALFESCMFVGLCATFAYSLKMQSCMFYLPVDITGLVTATWVGGIANGVSINYNCGLMITRGLNTSIDTCDFQGVAVGIDLVPMDPIGIQAVSITNNYYNGFENSVNAEVAIRGRINPSYATEIQTVDIKSCTFADYNFDGSQGPYFTDTCIRMGSNVVTWSHENTVVYAHFLEKLRIVDSSTKGFMYKDRYSSTAHRTKQISYDVLNVTSLGDKPGLIGGYVDGSITSVPMWVQKVTVVANKTIASTFSIVIRKSASALKLLTKASADYTYSDSSGNTMYVWERTMGGLWKFAESEICRMTFNTTTFDAADSGVNMKIIIDVGY